MSAPIVVGKPLPVSPMFMEDETARRFWRLSFRTDRQYACGQDAIGRSVLVKHEREEDQSYNRRLRVTKPRNYVGPIVRLFNDYVFRKAPSRADATSPLAESLIVDCDGMGTTLDAFMRSALLCAQVDRESYIMPESSGDASDPVTVAQMEATGLRPILKRIPVESIVWRDVDGGTLEECIMVCHDDGQDVAYYYTEETVQKLYLAKEGGGKALTVAGMDEPQAHGYPGCPVVMLRPLFDILGDAGCGDSQAGPIAEAQQAVFNLLSLLNEESYNSCFTQFVATGVAADQVGQAMMGSNRLLCLPNPAAKFEAIGADPAQSEVIRKNIVDEIANLYRASGIISVSPDSGSPESGVALGMRFNQLSANLAALTQAVAATEARLWSLMAGAWGFDAPEPTQYHADFDQPDMEKELRTLILGISSPSMPAEFKGKMAEVFAARNLKMDPDAIASAVAALNQPKPDGFSPFPEGT